MSQLLWTSLWTSSFGWIEIQIQFLKALYTFSIHELDNFQDWNFSSILITHQNPQEPQDLKFWDGGVYVGIYFICTANCRQGISRGLGNLLYSGCRYPKVG